MRSALSAVSARAWALSTSTCSTIVASWLPSDARPIRQWRRPEGAGAMTAMAFGNQGNAISPDAPDDRLALIDFGTGVERRFTYGELRRASGAVARGLLQRGLKRGDRVAILSLNRAEFLFSFLGIMQAGLVAVPVNYKLPADTVSYVVSDCD